MKILIITRQVGLDPVRPRWMKILIITRQVGLDLARYRGMWVIHNCTSSWSRSSASPLNEGFLTITRQGGVDQVRPR